MNVNIKGQRELIEETAPLDVRAQRIRAASSEMSFERERREADKAALEAIPDDSATRPRSSAEVSLRGVLFVLAILLVLLDAVCQYLINSTWLPDVSKRTWLVVSLPIALAIAAITHGVAQALSHDPTRPRRSVRLCLRWAGVFGLLSGLALVVILVARTATADMAEYLVAALSVSLWVLCEALPVTAGLTSAAAHGMYFDVIRRRRQQKIDQRLAELHAFDDWLKEELRKTEDLTPRHQAPTAGRDTAAERKAGEGRQAFKAGAELLEIGKGDAR